MWAWRLDADQFVAEALYKGNGQVIRCMASADMLNIIAQMVDVTKICYSVDIPVFGLIMSNMVGSSIDAHVCR